jgi:hypothetical protein
MLGSLIVSACTPASSPTSAKTSGEMATPSAHALVLRATACWMGGIWGDARGEDGTDRMAGIERRCNALLREIDLTKRERDRARADRVPAPAPEEAYYPLRAVEPHIVDGIADEVASRATKDPVEAPDAQNLVTLLRAVAAGTRETIRARRAADVVKADTVDQPVNPNYAADKAKAAAELEARAGIDALMTVDVGRYTEEARAIGSLTAVDRLEIARGLPKHLKIYAVGAAFEHIFHVAAPNVSPVAEAPIVSGIWLGYLTEVAAAAGHPVPGDAHDPQNREALAWAGVLGGFADRLRTSTAHSEGKPRELGDVENAVASRLYDEIQSDREAYEAHAAIDR